MKYFTNIAHIALTLFVIIGCMTAEAGDINENGSVDINEDLQSQVFRQPNGEHIMAWLNLKISDGQAAGNCSVTMYQAVQKDDKWVRGQDFYYSSLSGWAESMPSSSGPPTIELGLNSSSSNADEFEADCSFKDGSKVMECQVTYGGDTFTAHFHTVSGQPIANW